MPFILRVVPSVLSVMPFILRVVPSALSVAPPDPRMALSSHNAEEFHFPLPFGAVRRKDLRVAHLDDFA